jgi:hypothetical protein
MLDVWNRTEYYRDLAEECRRLATTSLSSQMKNRYSLMAKDYILLADVEEQVHAARTAIAHAGAERKARPQGN